MQPAPQQLTQQNAEQFVGQDRHPQGQIFLLKNWGSTVHVTVSGKA
jgi:hypothetical protein